MSEALPEEFDAGALGGLLAEGWGFDVEAADFAAVADASRAVTTSVRVTRLLFASCLLPAVGKPTRNVVVPRTDALFTHELARSRPSLA